MKPLLSVFLLAAAAQAQQYMVDHVLPRGGSRGSTVEVVLYGQALQNPKEIVFYRPGIQAVEIAAGVRPAEQVKAKFRIAPDCPPGEHVLRLRTATALSEAVTFWVGPFPTVQEKETKAGENDTPDKAQPVPLNSTVAGQIQEGPALDRDLYRVEARQGQRISVEVEAVRLGTVHRGGENDLAAAILDAEGKTLARSDDTPLFVQDPMVSIVAPRDGPYFIDIHQQVFTPLRLACYRAHIGTFSRPTAIFPAGGQAGATIDARILGDPAGERTERIALPATPGNFDYFAGAPGEQPPSPNVLRVSPYPNVLHTADPMPVPSLPAALNGIVAQPGQTDVYRFAAKKGQSWRIRVYGRTLGSPIDPRIWVRAAGQPKHLLDADDSKLADLGYPSARGTWHTKDQLDPVAIFRPGSDGEYELGVEDTRGMAGPGFVYRVEVEPARDAVYTHITMSEGYQIPRLTGLIVPRENRWTIDVQLAPAPGNTYQGEIELEAAGLPRGVEMIAPRFGKGVLRMPVQFVAARAAEQQAALIELRARPVDRSVPLDTGSRQGFALIDQPNEYPWHYVWLDRYALAVTQPAPFHIELEQPQTPLVQNGDLLLKVKVVRHGDFKEKIEIQPDWLPPGVSKQGAVTIPPDKTEATYRIQAAPRTAAGKFPIAINATTTGGDAFSGVGRIRVSSAFVDLTVAEPYLAVDFRRAAVERGKRAQLIGAVKLNKPFPGEASVRLVRLPKGVSLVEPAPKITARTREVDFQVEASGDTLPGLYKDIACEITLTEKGQEVKQQSGSGILRVDPARTEAPK